MREPSLSDPLYNLLGYFANGEIVFSDQYPSHLPNWDLFPVLLSRDLVEKVPINPNELIYHIDKPLRTSYYAISAPGKALYSLEKEIRIDRSRQEEADKAAKQAEEKRWRKDASRSWIQFWLTTFFSVIGFAVGVFVEHYFAILEVFLAIIG